jgi:hypothetical protein
MDMMNNNGDILNNVQAINVYAVPEGYFNDLADGIMSSIHLEAGKQFAQQGPYTIPDRYFEDLSSTILARLQAIPGTKSSPVDTAANEFLTTIGKGNVYEVPAHYFEQLPAQVISKVSSPAQGKVVSLRTITRNWISYASAAAVAGIMVVGAFMFTDNNQQPSSAYYNGFKNIDVKKGVSDLSESEIDTYLTAHPSLFEIPAPTRSVEAEIQRSIKNMSEEEITGYLQDNWEPGENPLKGI